MEQIVRRSEVETRRLYHSSPESNPGLTTDEVLAAMRSFGRTNGAVEYSFVPADRTKVSVTVVANEEFALIAYFSNGACECWEGYAVAEGSAHRFIEKCVGRSDEWRVIAWMWEQYDSYTM